MKKNKLLKKILFIITLAIIASSFLIKYYSDKISPLLIDYVDSKVRQITLAIINESLTEAIDSNYPNNILNIKRNSTNDIELINYNTKEVSKFLGVISDKAEEKIHKLEEGDIENLDISAYLLDNYSNENLIYSIPLGVASQNIFLSNLGPKIPIKLKLNSDIITGIKTQIKDYGINNALLELDINIEAEIQIILPFNHKISTITFTTPLSIELINGKVPSYYYGNNLEYQERLDSMTTTK